MGGLLLGKMAASGLAAKELLTFARLLDLGWSVAEGCQGQRAGTASVGQLFYLEARPGALAACYPWAEFAEHSTSGCYLLGIGITKQDGLLVCPSVITNLADTHRAS